jgi:multidrug efflux pump subunit AcrA (membrane-fusion protein)
VVKDNIVYYLATVKVSRDDSEFLKPEMTTHIKIAFAEKKDVLTVPNAAIKFETGKQVVYRVTAPNKVEKVAIQTGLRGEDATEVISGLRDGDMLATKLILPVSAKPEIQ